MKIARKHGHLRNGQVVTDSRETMRSGERMVIAQEHNNRFRRMAVDDEERFRSAGHMPVTGKQDQLHKSEMNTVRSNHMLTEEDQLNYWPDFSGHMDTGGGISSIFDHARLADEHQNLWAIGGPLFDQNEQSRNQYVEAEKIETIETLSHGVTPQGDEDMCIDMDISTP